MKVSAGLFEKSFFYIGAGYDIEPLQRFTHITDTFLYANLFIEKEKLIKWYDQKFKFGDFTIIEKTIIDDFDELDYFELNKEYIHQLMMPDFISHEELHSYIDTFQMAQNMPQYAVVYRLLKNSLNKEIILYIFTGEGIASYIALSQNGKYAPRILSTIETGVLEHPDGLMNNFYNTSHKKRPMLWIRGFEPRYSPDQIRNNALDEIGVFSKKALDLNQPYLCGWSYSPRQRTELRYCKGFVTPETYTYLVSLKLKKEYINKNHRFCFKGIDENQKNIKPGDIILMTAKFKRMPQFDGVTILFLEDLIGDCKKWNYWGSRHIINYLFKMLMIMQIPKESTFHIIPFFKEDVGDLYFQTLKSYPFKTVTYAKDPLDFIDLKEFGSISQNNN